MIELLIPRSAKRWRKSFAIRRLELSSVGSAARETIGRKMRREEGASIVEMALSLGVLLTVLLGLIQVCFALYTANVIDLAAREASRWSAVRGSNSCKVLSTFPYCNYSPTGYSASGTYAAGTSNDPVEIFVQGLGYPGLGYVTASATWWTATQDANGASQWTTACTGALDAYNQPCNSPGHMVKVTVSYAFPLNIVFHNTLSMNSTSAMVINN